MKILFIITGILALLFGLCCLLVPGGFYSFYGGNLTETGKLATQLEGAAYIAFAVILFFASTAGVSKARKAIVIGFFVHFVIALIICIKGVLSKGVNAWGWPTAAMFLVLMIAFGYFMIRKEPAA